MKIQATTALAALVATLIGGTQGYIGNETMEARRRLIKSPKGSPIPDEWIVTVETLSSCAEVEHQIHSALKVIQSNRLGVRAIDSNVRTAVAQVKTMCFVSFTGTEADKRAIESGFTGILSIQQKMEVMAEQAPPSWGLDRIDQPFLPLSQSPFKISHTGKGVNVYVIDTGLNKNHVEFRKLGSRVSRAEYGPDFSPTRQPTNPHSTDDQNGHGTHCAGTCCGKLHGVARDANIIGVKVLGNDGYGDDWGVIKGIEYAASANPPSVLSLSLGGGKSDALDIAIRAAAEDNIVVVAAGNENSDACAGSPSGAGGNVITVGSTDNTDARSYFSNWGECVHILAPGSDITSAWIGSRYATNTISGTSMATPHVAGVAAALLEKFEGHLFAARMELFRLARTNIISDVRGSYNAFLQAPLL